MRKGTPGPRDDGFGVHLVAINPITEQIYYEGDYDTKLWHLDQAIKSVLAWVRGGSAGPVEIKREYNEDRSVLTLFLV